MSVERLIGDVARDLATAEPRADFSARVFDRIIAADRRSRTIKRAGMATGLLAEMTRTFTGGSVTSSSPSPSRVMLSARVGAVLRSSRYSAPQFTPKNPRVS